MSHNNPLAFLTSGIRFSKNKNPAKLLAKAGSTADVKSSAKSSAKKASILPSLDLFDAVKDEAISHEASDDESLLDVDVSEDTIQKALKKSKLRLTGEEPPNAMIHFSQLSEQHVALEEENVKQVVNTLRNYERMTPIQMIALPSLISGRDFIGISPTGSGKTLSYLIPIAMAAKPAIVVVPTVELGLQIKKVFTSLISKLEKVPDLVDHVYIGTPHHVLSMLTPAAASRIAYLVFDEADRLFLEEDFLKQVDTLVSMTKKDTSSSSKRQHGGKGSKRKHGGESVTHKPVFALFSATLPEKVEMLATQLMERPLRAIMHFRNAANTLVSQELVFCGSEEGKLVYLKNLFSGIAGAQKSDVALFPMLMFCQSIERVVELHDFMKKNLPAIKSSAVHAEMTVEQRAKVLDEFHKKKIWVLICTDLLARGMDFVHVRTVVNYDFPQNVPSYLHRIGRTARSIEGKKEGSSKGYRGRALTLFTEDDASYLRAIVSVMRQSGCIVPDWMLELKKPSRSKRRNWEEAPRKRQSVKDAATKGSAVDREDEIQRRRAKRRKLMEKEGPGGDENGNDNVEDEDEELTEGDE
jgi:ATP-dependent RNA helicase DDX52/ROK1